MFLIAIIAMIDTKAIEIIETMYAISIKPPLSIIIIRAGITIQLKQTMSVLFSVLPYLPNFFDKCIIH